MKKRLSARLKISGLALPIVSSDRLVRVIKLGRRRGWQDARVQKRSKWKKSIEARNRFLLERIVRNFEKKGRKRQENYRFLY